VGLAVAGSVEWWQARSVGAVGVSSGCPGQEVAGSVGRSGGTACTAWGYFGFDYKKHPYTPLKENSMSETLINQGKLCTANFSPDTT